MLTNSLEENVVQLGSRTVLVPFPGPTVLSHCAVELVVAVESHKLDKLDRFSILASCFL